jgi:hypothetical protein
MTSESPMGERLAELPLEFERSSHGRAGSIWMASDSTGTLSVSLEFNVVTKALRINLNVKALERYYPHEVLPAFRFLDAFVTPNRFVLFTEDGEHLSDMALASGDSWINPLMLPLVEGQALIQTASRRLRRVRAGASKQEIADVRSAAALLRGDSLSGAWTHLSMQTTEPLRFESLDEEHDIELLINEPYTVTFDGYTYTIGSGTTVNAQGRLVGILVRDGDSLSVAPLPPEWLAARTVPSSIEVVFEAAANEMLSRRLVR